MDETIVRSVSAVDEGGAFILAFETRANEGLIFQLANRIDGQDSMLGLDSYSVSSDDGSTVYGGIANATLNGLALILTWHEDAADAIGLPDQLHLRLPDDAAVEKAVAGLLRIGIKVQTCRDNGLRTDKSGLLSAERCPLRSVIRECLRELRAEASVAGGARR